MKHWKSRASLLLVSLFALSMVTVLPAAAHEGEDHGAASSSDDSRRDIGREAAKRVAAASQESIEKGRQLVAEERKKGTQRSVEQRQKACQAREASLEKRVDSYRRHGERHLATFDRIYERIQVFHDEKKLDAANYDELVAAADARQMAAADTVDTLTEVSADIDCTSDDPAASVAAIKTAVAETRAALKDYRTAIKDVILSLNASLEKQPDDSGNDAGDDKGGVNRETRTTDDNPSSSDIVETEANQ